MRSVFVVSRHATSPYRRETQSRMRTEVQVNAIIASGLENMKIERILSSGTKLGELEELRPRAGDEEARCTAG